MFPDGLRIVSSTLIGKVVSNNHALFSTDLANACYHISTGNTFAACWIITCQLAYLKKRRTLIKDPVDPLSWQELLPLICNLPLSLTHVDSAPDDIIKLLIDFSHLLIVLKVVT